MVWWWIADVVLILGVIPIVVVLANGVVARIREIDAYASDVLEHGFAVTVNLDPVPELATTADLVSTARELSSQYASRIGRAMRGGR